MAISYDEYRARGYFPALDGIRAVSIVLVMTVHLYYENFSWKWLYGESGVTIFFVLSGYLITMLALREEGRSGSLSLKAFYIRRAFRIFPLYFLVLCLYCLLILGFGFGGAYDHGRFGRALPYYLFYLNEYAPDAPFYHSWSLGIEEKFYLVWPAIAFLLLKNRRLPRIAAASALVVSLPVAAMIFPSASLRGYYPIAIGCLFALVLHERKGFEALRILGSRTSSFVIVGALAAVQLSLAVYGFLTYLYPLIAALLVVNAVMANPGWLKWRPLRLIGERSYGMYLVHILCIRAAKIFFPPGTTSLWVSICGLLAGVCLSYVFAWLLSRSVERPCINLGKVLSAGMHKKDAYDGRAVLAAERAE